MMYLMGFSARLQRPSETVSSLLRENIAVTGIASKIGLDLSRRPYNYVDSHSAVMFVLLLVWLTALLKHY